MSSPRHALDSWNEIAGQIRRAPHLALFTDFDGTLVRIRKHPDHVVLPARVRSLLGSIAHAGVTVGVVSGREVADVRKRVSLTRIWYVGAHGFFIRDPANRAIALVSREERERIRTIKRILTRRLRGVPGLRLEPKEATIAVHYRAAPARSVHLARNVMIGLMKRYPELCSLPGKKVLGFLPGPRTDKWTAISFILRRERRKSPRGRWLAIFLGDDATDERVFHKMHGISVAVGKKHRTAARYYLRSPAEVIRFLEKVKSAFT
ncbi:MAG TPA: trehalose-phosphatase [Candidatus Acidoferrum sp.]|nr:trehalose-phosphatase [Candidatus Acidoferrum sp.]